MNGLRKLRNRHSATARQLRNRTRRTFFEQLEQRQLLASVPIGTVPADAYVPNHLIVGFQSTATSADRTAILGQQNLRVLQSWDSLNAVLTDASGTTGGLAAAQSRLQANSKVRYAEADYYGHTTAYTGLVPNDPMFPQQWGLHNGGQLPTAGGGVGKPGADIHAPEAWNTSVGTADVVIAVIDSGVKYTHPDLVANMWHNAREIAADGIDNDQNGYIDDVYGIDTVNNDSDPIDDNGHGTHVAGIGRPPLETIASASRA